MKPKEAHNDSNTMNVFHNTLNRYPLKSVGGRRPPKYKFRKGDLVRIYKSHDALRSKGYLPRYTWEIFRIRAWANTRALDQEAILAYILK